MKRRYVEQAKDADRAGPKGIRDDIFDIASYGTKLGLRMVMAPNGTLITSENAQKMKESGIKRISVSLDGSTPETHGLDAVTGGCLAGTGFCFISHVGRVQTCGFLDVDCGDITKQNFKDVWEKSKVFKTLRNFDNLENKCGICEYKNVCGGCRARAYEATGSYLTEEPLCSYQPRKSR